MSRIFLDIRDSLLNALIYDGDSLRYECSFDVHSVEWQESKGKEPTQHEELLFHRTGGKETVLSSILSRIIKQSAVNVTSGYLLAPDSRLMSDTITLPKIDPEDASRIIERKFNPSGALQLYISLVEESSHSQVWSVEYLPGELVKKYEDSFKSAGVKLQGITTANHVALHAIPGEYSMSAGRVYALYDTSLNAVEGFYFYESRLIHKERFILDETASGQISGNEEQLRKMKLFKMLDGIYRINANFAFSNPGSDIHQLLLCGTHPQIGEIAESLSEAMGIEVFVLSMFDTVYSTAGRYALLTGYLNALQQGVAVDFLRHEILQQKALRVRTGVYIYSLTVLLALGSVAVRENTYRKVSAELAGEKQKLSQLKTVSVKSLKIAETITALNKEVDADALFYALFRDFANNLPDGAFLKGVQIKRLKSGRTMEIVAVTRKTPDIHVRKILSRLQGYLSTSAFFQLSKEPVITIVGKDNDRSVEMKFVCELVTK